MSTAEWLRTFLAIYRSGSVTEGAYHRGLSQPAASQQLAALERVVRGPLFVRRPSGVEPTPDGRDLYARIAGPLDGLESVLRRLDAGTPPSAEPPVRFGSSPEYFAAELLPRLVGMDLDLTASFGSDPNLLAMVERGDVDVAVTSSTPSRRGVTAVPAGTKRFTLVGSPDVAPARPLRDLDELGRWLVGRPWASYSLEMAITRRFWTTVLGRPVAARPRLVAPDLRAVLRAVELGLGVSLLPMFVCTDALAEGRVAELYPVADLIAEEPWFVCTRPGDADRPAVARLVDRLVQVDPRSAAGSTDRGDRGGGRSPG